MTLPFTQRLAAVLSAPYPYVILSTFEEDRALALLHQVAAALGRAVSVWRPEDHSDPARALSSAADSWSTTAARAIHCVVDAHPYLSTPERVRALRRAVPTLMAREAAVVFISPTFVVPFDLERDFVTLDVPLPDRDELAGIARRVAGDDADAAALERAVNAALGMTARDALRAFVVARGLPSASTGTTRGAWEDTVRDEKRRLLDAHSALEFVSVEPGSVGVGGLDELKRWVSERQRALSDEARRFGLPTLRGLLLLGVQGCGKSLAARALSSAWGLPLLRLDLGALFDGERPAEPTLRRATLAAEAMAPCVLWVDEIEKGFSADDPVTTRMLGALLTWLQDKTAPVFFVATANHVETLPPELMRRGRFDEIFFVDLPDLEARREIARIHLERRGRRAEDFDLTRIAQLTQNYSGAELEQVVVAALFTAFAAHRDITSADLEGAARSLIPLYTLREVEVKALRAWARDRARPAGHDRSLVDLFGS